MEIAFFTEAGFIGKTPRSNQNMRTEYAWYTALEADHYNIHSGNIDKEYDLGIIIIPKKNPEFNLNRIKNQCKQTASMQEGPHWYWQDYPLEQQIWFYNILQEMDFLFAHNNIDKKYYEGLTGKACHVMPSLMIEDSIKDLPEVDRSGVMIGGNFCQWYGGFDSYITAQEFGTGIFVPSMGRKIEGEESIPVLNHLPYMNWVEWIHELNKRKYAVHLMRTHAAGTFALNCAYLGIPCIGYKGLDTQEVCHPDTTIEVGDITKAKQIAEKLRNDEEFYLYCSNKAKNNYKELYHEDKFNTTFQEQFKVS
tara:strand:+ start:1988 stop:2911 length:924 start_codon:yes stop_codon:yes gene_type:complete